MTDAPKYIGPDEEGYHCHQCPTCFTIWAHENVCAGNDEAHQCPVPGCDGVSYIHHTDTTAPLVSCMTQKRISL